MQDSDKICSSYRAALDKAAAALHTQARAQAPPPVGNLTLDGGLRLYASMASEQIRRQRSPVRRTTALSAPLSYTQQHDRRRQQLAAQPGVHIADADSSAHPAQAAWR